MPLLDLVMQKPNSIVPQDLNQSLASKMNPPTYWVYTDGSATTHSTKTGGHAAMIVAPDGTRHFVLGVSCWTKINRQELTAVNEALRYIREIILGGFADPCSVQVVSDSTYVVNGTTNPDSRHANLDLWAQFDILARHFIISIVHISRNDEPSQAQADAMCSLARSAFEQWVKKLEAVPDFQRGCFCRTSNWNPSHHAETVAHEQSLKMLKENEVLKKRNR